METNYLISSISYFNLGGLKLCLGGKPTNPRPRGDGIEINPSKARVTISSTIIYIVHLAHFSMEIILISLSFRKYNTFKKLKFCIRKYNRQSCTTFLITNIGKKCWEPFVVPTWNFWRFKPFPDIINYSGFIQDLWLNQKFFGKKWTKRDLIGSYWSACNKWHYDFDLLESVHRSQVQRQDESLIITDDVNRVTFVISIRSYCVQQGSLTFLKLRATSCVPINAKGY